MPLQSNYKLDEDKYNHHKILQSNFIAQTQSLMMGKNKSEVEDEMSNEIIENPNLKKLVSHRTFEGNRPTNSILFKSLSPKSLGRLVAMYEHKIFTQGIIWNINSFDQWGVEYGKQIAKLVLPKLESKDETKSFDSSTNNLINYINNNS
jgi:glucose-6-phosphate isomerase